LDSQAGSDSLRYGLQTGVEEALELLGASVMLYALLDALSRRTAGLRLVVCPSVDVLGP
jgi:hypothetical protein